MNGTKTSDKQLRNGIELIVESFEKLKEKLEKLEIETAQKEAKIQELTNIIETNQANYKTCYNKLLSKYNQMRKNVDFLDSFRKQIVSMIEVNQIHNVDTSFLENETNLDLILNGSIGAVDDMKDKSLMDKTFDVVSKKTLNDLETLHLTPFKTGVEKSPFSNLKHQNFLSSKEVDKSMDAPTLYKKIREVLDPNEFDLFATNIAIFNAGNQSADDTIAQIGKLVKEPQLVSQMQKLILRAVNEQPSIG